MMKNWDFHNKTRRKINSEVDNFDIILVFEYNNMIYDFNKKDDS